MDVFKHAKNLLLLKALIYTVKTPTDQEMDRTIYAHLYIKGDLKHPPPQALLK